MLRIFIVVAIFSLTVPVLAQDPPGAPVKDARASDLSLGGPNATLYSNFRSKYLVDQGIDLSDGEPVIQSGLTLDWENGIYLDLWHSTSFRTGLNNDFGDEVDLTLGWVHNTEGGFRLKLEAAYFNLFPLDELGGSNIFQPSLEISRDVEVNKNHTISPYGKLAGFWTMDGSEKGKIFPSGGVRHSWRIDQKWSVYQRATLLHDPGVFGLGSGLMGIYEVGVSWQITDQLTLSPLNLKVTAPLSPFSDGRSKDFSLGFGGSWGF